MEMLLVVMVLVLAVAGPLWGADTRDGRDWQARGEWQPREERARARARSAIP
jgi:hypothetical protein